MVTVTAARVSVDAGIELAVDRYEGENSSAILVSHGIFCHRRLPEIQALATSLSDSFDVWTVDCRGHGDSSGRFSFGLWEWRDLAVLARGMRSRYRRVGGIGFSFGAFHTCLAGARTGAFDSLALVSPPQDLWILDHSPLRRGFFKSLAAMRRRARKPTRLAFDLSPRLTPIDCASSLTAATHYIHGDHDWVVHHSHSEALYSRTPDPKKLSILPGGLHAEYLLEQMPEILVPMVEQWFAETMSKHSDDG